MRSPPSARCWLCGRRLAWNSARWRVGLIGRVPRCAAGGIAFERSPTLLAEVVEVAIGLDPAPLEVRLSGEAAVFEALEQAFSHARRRFGEERVGDVWRFWSCISGGRTLATNTSAP